MPSFMMEIDAAQRSPLEQLAHDHLYDRRLLRSGYSIEFCRRVAGVPDSDEAIAKRLRVFVSTVREWREVGRRANRWSCQ